LAARRIRRAHQAAGAGVREHCFGDEARGGHVIGCVLYSEKRKRAKNKNRLPEDFAAGGV
jgi:hypothetical protein